MIAAIGCVLWSGTNAQGTDSLRMEDLRTTPDSGYTWPERENKGQLVFFTQAVHDASSIRNEMVAALWRGGDISREVRERSANNGGGTERAGYILEAGLSLSWGKRFLGSDRLRPRVALAWHDVLGLRYSDDLYHLTFFGNGDMENGTATLAPSAFEKIRYQTIGFGLEWERSGSFLMLHLVNGQDLSSARIRKADLYTAMDGRYLSLELDGGHARSADDGTNAWRSRGIGAAISFRWTKAFMAGRHSMRATLGGDDLGLTVWNNRSLSVRRDTSILYEGIRLTDVLELDNVLIDREAIQDTLGLGFKRGSFVRPLPGRVYGSLALYGAHRMRYQAEVVMRHLPGYLPHAILSATRMNDRAWYRAELSYGAFGGLRGGLVAGWRPCDGFWLELGLRNLTGLMGGRMQGQALTLGVGYSW